jgi:pimeloyl-ACP methyl ester carboxylesterase
MPYALNGNTKIWWESVGDGEPVVLISGFTSDSGAWFRVVPHLTGYRVITIDNRGTGRSDSPRGAYTYAVMASDVVSVLDAAHETVSHVIGISMGSCIAQEVALDHPERVRSLTLVSSNPGTRSSVLPSLSIRVKIGAVAFSKSQVVQRWLEALTYQPSTSRERVREDTERRKAVAIKRRGLFGQLRGVTSWDRSQELTRLKMPTLILHGENDSIDPVENGRRLAAAIPGSELVILPDANHQVFTDKEEESLGAITDFLNRHSA